MNQFRIVRLSVLLFACVALAGCFADVNLKDIDPSAKVGMRLALPVGEMEATIGDFLKDTTVDFISIREDGIYEIATTINYKREFHYINLAQYTSKTEKNCKLKAAGYDMVAAGTQTLEFPVTMKLNQINRQSTLEDERIDRIVVDTARFTSQLTNTMGLSWSDIQSLELVLPDEQFSRNGGQNINIPLAGYDFGEDIPVMVDNFTINLMKDPNGTPDNNNVDSVLTMAIRLSVNFPETRATTSSDAFGYTLGLNFLEYSAIYGKFKLSNQLHDVSEINIGDEWELWNSLKHLNLPIADPSILLDITTAVSAPLHGHIEYLEVEDLTTKETRRAYNFDGVASQTSYDRFFPNVLPLDAPIGSTVTNTLAFGSNNGALGSLFEIRPDIVRYEYYIDTWEGSPIMKQHRLTKDTRVSLDAHITVPFTFHEGLRLSYGDTADVNFEKIALDSLINNVEMIDSLTLNDLKLVLTAQSWIPFDISGTVTFLDENGKDLGITVNDSNIIKINGPIDYNGSLVNTPGESVLIIDVDQDDLDKISKTRQLIYSLDMRDVDVSKLKNKGAVFPVSLAEYTKLRIKVALSADVEAYLKLQFN